MRRGSVICANAVCSPDALSRTGDSLWGEFEPVDCDGYHRLPRERHRHRVHRDPTSRTLFEVLQVGAGKRQQVVLDSAPLHHVLQHLRCVLGAQPRLIFKRISGKIPDRIVPLLLRVSSPSANTYRERHQAACGSDYVDPSILAVQTFCTLPESSYNLNAPIDGRVEILAVVIVADSLVPRSVAHEGAVS
jgi:hypothetical protein